MEWILTNQLAEFELDHETGISAYFIRLWDFLEAQEHERTAENDEYVLEEVTEDGEQE